MNRLCLSFLVGFSLVSAAAFAAPVNDQFDSATLITGGAGSVRGSNEGASAEPNEPRPVAQAAGASVWWRWTAPASGRVEFSTIGSHYDTVMAAYVGDALPSLVAVAENDDAYPELPDPIYMGAVFGYHSRVSFEAVAGTTYGIVVDGRIGASSVSGQVVLTWIQGMGHDDFAGAIEIAGEEGIALGTTVGATNEPGEPNHFGFNSGSSVWWRWTAPWSGVVTFSLVRTQEEDFETLLAIYTGESVDTLSLVAGNDESFDFFVKLNSGVTFGIEEGTTYWIAVDGAFGATPDVVLRWTRDRENDAFLEAFEIEGPAGTTTGDNIFASAEEHWFPADHGGQPGSATVWWKWTPSTSGRVAFDTHGSTFDTVLAVYTGDEVWAEGVPFPMLELTMVASNDDAADSAQSRVEFQAEAGTTYKITVANFHPADRGDIVLNWRPANPPAESVRFEAVSRLADGSLRLVLGGPSGASGSVHRSSDLVTWKLWLSFTLQSGATQLTDTQAETAHSMYYRVVTP